MTDIEKDKHKGGQTWIYKITETKRQTNYTPKQNTFLERKKTKKKEVEK